jgi:peptide-methionine (R)-S-oxide reductase
MAMEKPILTDAKTSNGVDRRSFFRAAASLAGGVVLWHFWTREPVQANPYYAGGAPKLVKIVQFSDAGKKLGVVSEPQVVKSDEEWRKQLTPDEYEITRNAGTERPFTGTLLNVHDKGVFRCICCDNALFSASTKFDSGTGWPSFWAPIASENVIETTDSSLGMERTAVSCRLCVAHLRHVFNDGPQPTGLRYCMNSLAMKFAKA